MYNAFNNMNNSNSLAELLKQYLPQNQQPIQEPAQTQTELQRGYTNTTTYEINSKADIEYIECDKSGRMQVYLCPNEKRIYTSRFNHVKKEPDYKVYIEEEEIELFKQKNNNSEINLITEALTALLNEIKTLSSTQTSIQNDIQLLKDNPPKQIIREIEPKIIEVEKIVEKEVEPTNNMVEPGRGSNGRFTKKGSK